MSAGSTTPLWGRRVLDVRVEGKPRPKGSLKVSNHNGRVWLREQVDPDGVWRTQVAQAVKTAAKEANLPTPVDTPVSLAVVFWFTRPGRPEFDFPAGRMYGDIEKLIRNVGDALQPAPANKPLQGAGLITDDARIVCIEQAWKLWAAPGRPPGCLLRVFLDPPIPPNGW